MHHPKVCLDLSVLAKKNTTSHLYIKKFNEIKDEYSYYTAIYTDGSKDNDRVGCGLIINKLSGSPVGQCTLIFDLMRNLYIYNTCIYIYPIKQRLPRNASIFTAEDTAIDLALDTITESENDHFIIISYSPLVFLSLHNRKMDNPLILKH